MLRSSAKRRKVSPTAAVSVTASAEPSLAQSNPTTPTRASYRSPTKASLARSHPDILAKSPGRKPQTASRAKNLRQELLGGRKAQSRTSISNHDSVSVPPTEQHREIESNSKTPATNNTASLDGFSAAVAQAFERPLPSQSLPRQPLQSRQPTVLQTDSPSRASSIEALPALALPKLVKRPTAPTSQNPRARLDDLDLPPTPVQLGIAPPPERPRGLASSSSPRSSRSGSGKNRTRVRRGAATSSPLKPRDNHSDRAVARHEGNDQNGRAQEAPESEPQEGEETHHLVSEELKQKQVLLGELRTQLERLRSELGELEAAANAPDDSSSANPDPRLLTLLTTNNPSCDPESTLAETSRATSPPLLNPIKLDEQPHDYLTLFSPGNLELSTKTSTRAISNGQIHLIHVFTLTAPAPWPRHIFNATFKVISDAEDARIISVTLQKTPKGTGSRVLLRAVSSWIDSRLSSPLHRSDIGGIIWGLGSYFDECVRRAKAFKILEGKYNTANPNDPIAQELIDHYSQNDFKLTSQDIPHLAVYLPQNSLEFSLKPLSSATTTSTSSSTSTSNSNGGKRKRHTDRDPQILLTWTISLDWTGQAHSNIDIATSRLPTGAQESAKEVFTTLCRRRGVVGAVEGVWGAIGGGMGVEG